MRPIEITRGAAHDIATLESIMGDAFDPRFGEAWTAGQCLGIMAMPGVWADIAHRDDRPIGFALTRAVADEAELLLLATRPAQRRCGIGRALLRGVIAECRSRGVAALHLEMRAGNDARHLYRQEGFTRVGERPRYYRGTNGEVHDAHSYRLVLG